MEDLFVGTALAFGALEREAIPDTGRRVTHRVTLAAADQPGLLVDWINELVFLAESQAWIPEQVELKLVGPAALEATIQGLGLEHPPALVKAATHHQLKLSQTDDGWLGEVVLDV